MKMITAKDFNKENYMVILKDLYISKGDDVFNNVMYYLTNFIFIASLSLSELLSDNSDNKNKDVIASTHFLFLDFESLVERGIEKLKYSSQSEDINIIKISWLATISLSDEIEVKEYVFTNVYNVEYKIVVRSMSYPTFFKNMNVVSDSLTDYEKQEKQYIGVNPIFVFEGLTWNNIVHLFKENNIVINGGSITRRHKLSICEYRLSKFLYLMVDLNKEVFYDWYTDKYITSPRYDRKNPINMADQPYVSQYKTINTYLNLKMQENEIAEKISNGELKISNIKSRLISLRKYLSKNESEIESNEHSISILKQKKEGNGIKEKQKASLTGRIKNSNMTIQKLRKENRAYSSEILILERDLSENLNTLKTLKAKYEDIIKEVVIYKSNIKVYNNNNNNNNNIVGNSSISNRRTYHSLSSRRYYTTNNSIKKLNFNFDSPILIELQRILNTSVLDENTQIKIEKFLINQGQILLKKRIDQELDLNYYKINPYILKILDESISELNILIDNYRINLNNLVNVDDGENIGRVLLNSLNNDIIISQLLGRLLRIISNNNLLNKNTKSVDLAKDLADSLLFLYYTIEYNKLASKDMSLSIFIENKSLIKNVSSLILIQFGLKLLNFLEEVKLIHSTEHRLSRDLNFNIYVADKKIIDSIGKNMALLNISYKIPMIVPPKPYTRKDGVDSLGGYLLNDKEYVMPLIIKNSELREQSIIKNENIILEVVNRLSSVGYKINIPVLDFILDKGVEYGLFIDPNFTHPLEIKKNDNQKLSMFERKSLDSFLSIKQLEMNILGLAVLFKNVPEFFIPVRLDNRGRIYCVSDYLNYQGIELAKSLLLFSKGEKINKCDKQSIDYLKIYGATCFGNGVDKKSYNDKVKWVDDNEEDILNFRYGKLIQQAESKLLFIAFCFEYENYKNSLFSNDSTYTSFFPIQLDATCNGYQHLSLLTGEESLAKQLNLINGSVNEIPKDFYGFIAVKINEYLKSLYSDLEKQLPHQMDDDYKKYKASIESCKRLLKLDINRQLVKLPIMVKPYNASFFRLVDYFKENFDMKKIELNNENNLFPEIDAPLKDIDIYVDKSNKQVKLLYNDLVLFISVLEKVIILEFPKLKKFNLYLEKVAEICSILNISITWVLPHGLNVYQYYLESKDIRLKPFRYRKTTYSLKINTGDGHRTKQIRALMPNLIHSLDAASLALTVDMFYNYKNSSNINFFSIHDCFAVTSNNVSCLINIVKLVYIKIYSDDNYLKLFDDGIINSIKLQYGEKAFDDKQKIIKVDNLTLNYPKVDDVIVGRIKACQIMSSINIIR